MVDSDSNPSSYAFMSGHGEITEEAFVHRYEEITGQTDLGEVTRRNPGTGLLVTGAVMTSIGSIGALALFASSQTMSGCGQTPQSPCFNQESSSQLSASLGEIGFGVVALAGAALFVTGLHFNRISHELSREDAERFAHRYNRALLRASLVRAPAPLDRR
jgi:hypothetical protein